MTTISAEKIYTETCVTKNYQEDTTFQEIIALYPYIKSFVISKVGNVDKAEDIAQQVYEKAWRYRESVGEIKHVKAWLIRIAKNVIIDSWRYDENRPVTLVDTIDDQWLMDSNIDEQTYEKIENTEAILEIIGQAGDERFDLRTIFSLVSEGYQLKEAAKILGISETCIKARVFTARAALSKLGITYHQSRMEIFGE